MRIDPKLSPLVQMMIDNKMIEKNKLNLNLISRICLRPKDKERSYLIPYLCECVMDSFYDKEPLFEPAGSLHAIAEIYKLLEKSFNFGKLICQCHNDKSYNLKGFYVEKIEESSIDNWNFIEPFLSKDKCKTCKGTTSKIIIDESLCINCEGRGFTIDIKNKDAHLCEMCKGHRRIKNEIINSCEGCTGLGFKPRLLKLEYADLNAPCDNYYIPFGYHGHNFKIKERIACGNCEGKCLTTPENFDYEYISSYNDDQFLSLSLRKIVGFQFVNKESNDDIEYGFNFVHISDFSRFFGTCEFANELLSIAESYRSMYHQDAITDEIFFSVDVEKSIIGRYTIRTKLAIECYACNGSGALGICRPGNETKYTQYGKAETGKIRVFRYADFIQ